MGHIFNSVINFLGMELMVLILSDIKINEFSSSRLSSSKSEEKIFGNLSKNF